MKADPLSYGAVALLTIVWGSSFALTTLALGAYDPLEIALGRIWLSSVILIVILGALRLRLPPIGPVWIYLALTGVFSLILPFFLLAWGQQHIPSSLAAIFMSGTPLFVLVLARLFLSEPIGPRKWLGFAIGLSGLVLLIGPGALAAVATASTLGQLACIGAGLSYATSSIIIRKMPQDLHPITATAAAQAVAAVLSLPMLALAWPIPGTIGIPLLALVALGLFQTGAAQVLRFFTIRRSGPVFISIVGYLIPLWATFLGVAFLGEVVTLQTTLAFGLVIAGLLVARPGHQDEIRKI